MSPPDQAEGRSRNLGTLFTAVNSLARRSYRTLLDGWTRFADSRALAKRGSTRPEGAERWLREDERRLLTAIAATLLPSDETSPGAVEAGVVEALDHKLARTQPRQGLYARGLASCDRLSQKRHRRSFIDLTAPEREDLLREIERSFGPGHASATSSGRVLRGLLRLYANVRFPAVQLFPVLLEDVMEAFYTHPVSWQWLDYDGPPMPEGYLDLHHTRNR